MKASDRYFHFVEMFSPTQSDWEELFAELESLKPAELSAAFHGREDSPYWNEM